MFSSYLKRLLSAGGDASIRRLVALVMCIHLVIASYVVLFFKAEIRNTKLVELVLEYDFWLIVAGLGFVTVGDFAAAFMKRAEAKVVQAVSGTPETTVQVDNIEQVDTDTIEKP